MAQLYLSLSDHAVSELMAAHTAFETLQTLKSDEIRPPLLARAVISLHLAMDKATKAGLAQIDPALLVRSLSGETIQRLHRERIQQKVPTILAVPGKEETHHLVGLLHIGKPFFVPPLEEQQYDEFLGQIEDLVNIRNQMVHKEFVGEFDHVATVMVQVLSRIRTIMTVVAPGFLRTAFQSNDQLESRLKALELEVDAAWQVLVDFLGEGKELDVPIDVWITIAPAREIADVSLSSATFLMNALSANIQIPRSVAGDFLLREMPPPPPRPVLLYDLPTISSPSSSSSTSSTGLGGLSAIGRLAIGRFLKPEERPIVPTQPGSILARQVPARLSLSLAGRKKSSLALNVILDEMQLTFDVGKHEGSFTASLRPTKAGGKAKIMSAVRLKGVAFVESEFSVSTSSEHFVTGTTLRRIRISAKLKSEKT